MEPRPQQSYFNPLIPRGMRHIGIRRKWFNCYFNPLIPSGMRPVELKAGRLLFWFQSTHPKRDETAAAPSIAGAQNHISIHSSQAGWDVIAKMIFTQAALFQSTHPKRDETFKRIWNSLHLWFQSTHPKRDETSCRQSHFCTGLDFNPLIPSGMRLPIFDEDYRLTLISIHSSQAGWD